jgi:hypothetical protein
VESPGIPHCAALLAVAFTMMVSSAMTGCSRSEEPSPAAPRNQSISQPASTAELELLARSETGGHKRLTSSQEDYDAEHARAMLLLEQSAPASSVFRAGTSTTVMTTPVKPTHVGTANVPYIWNVWLEDTQKQQFLAQPRIERGRDYLVKLDLAAFAYQKENSGLRSKESAPVLTETLARIAKVRDSVDLDAVLIFDSTFFNAPAAKELVQLIPVNLKRLRDYATAPPAAVDVASETFKAQRGTSPLVWGTVAFSIRTKNEFPAGVRHANLAISIWDRTKQIPLDEISFTVCAQADCDGLDMASSVFTGADLLRSGSPPQAAIHLVELGTGKLHGVFSRKREALQPGAGPYESWETGLNFVDLRTQMESRGQDLGGASEKEQLRIGDGLFNKLVPVGTEVRPSIERLFKALVQGEKYALDEMPSIYFRAAARDAPGHPILWPLGLLAIDAGNGQGLRFLGRHARIESPLSVRNDDVTDLCVSDWVVVGPAKEGVTKTSRTRLGAGGLARLGPDGGDSLLIADAQVEIMDDMDKFFAYVHDRDGTTGEASDSEVPRSVAPQILTILSHHDRGRVFFMEGGNAPSVRADNVLRVFEKPSITILNGCNTAGFGPGSTELLAKLNQNGIDAAIATVAEVPADMAGDFLDCFLEQVEAAGKDGVRVGIAHTKTLRCLERRAPTSNAAPYGAKALLYGLLGNSSLRICPPAGTAP